MRAFAKKALKPLVPEPLHRLWRRWRFRQEQRAVVNLPLAQVFEDIYEKDAWAKAEGGRRYSSGPGSAAHMTRGYEEFLVRYIEDRPDIQTLVDIGCGDFQVAERVLARLSRPLRYIGCDIAANVIDYNQEHFAKDGVSFLALDVTKDQAPAGDIVTVREVFQHLSNDAILAALANLGRTFRTAIVTEASHVAITRPNVDLVSGYRARDGHDSAVILDQPPFNRKLLETHVLGGGGGFVLKTVIVEL